MSELPPGVAPKMLDTKASCAYLGNMPARTFKHYVDYGYIVPLVPGRYLISELDELIEKLKKARQLALTTNPDTVDEDADSDTEERRAIHGVCPVGAGTEGEGPRLRLVSGGSNSGRRKKRSGQKAVSGGGAVAYPDLPGVYD